MNSKGITKKWIIIFLHVFFFFFIFFLPYFFRTDYNNNDHAKKLPANFFYIYLIDFLTRVCIFYFNTYILIPFLFYKRKYAHYASGLLLVFVMLFLINRLTFYILFPTSQFHLNGFVLYSVFPAIFIVALSIAFKMFSDQIKNEAKTKEKETENLKTELSFLRSQISPHFMFNVLNNMVALARKNSDQLEPSLIKLSSLLRYMLYETNEQSVALEKEVEYLQSYIDLQLQRFGKGVKINVFLKEIDNSYFIEPMLLVPFVENAFKHGVSMVEDAEIDIELKVKEGLLEFQVKNKFTETEQTNDHDSGIGLNNVQRRLNLLYNNRHNLTITKKDNWFMILLQINLH